MIRRPTLRGWATPLTIGAFLLMAGTGVLMFFGLDRGLVVIVHQWFSWFFLIGAAGHVTANVRPFTNHLRSAWGRLSVAFFGIALVLSLASWGLVTGPQLERPVEEALVTAPLSGLAGLVRTSPDDLVARLGRLGVRARPEQSVHELAEASGIGENRLLGAIFLHAPSAPRR